MIKNEIESIISNHTCILNDLPSRTKPLYYKWIFKKKIMPDGIIKKIVRLSLLLMIFDKKLALIILHFCACIITIRVLLFIPSIHKLLVHLIDMKIVFPYKELE